ncbi:MAG: aldehyde dehydrogenase, partial [Actinobacteria bacterium]
MTPSTWWKSSPSPPPRGTTMPISSSGSASRPSFRSASSSRLRSGMRAASTRIVLGISSPLVGRFGSEIYRTGRRDKRAKFRSMAVTAGQEYGLFIGGEVVEPASGEIRDLHEPATGEPLARAAMAGEADVDRAVEAARAALDGPWGKTPPNERARLLHALADAIVANRKELAELESRNVGKAISSVKAEVAGAVENFRFFGSVVGSIAGRSNPIGGSLLSYTLKEPVGVCAQIVPWNYPLLMSVWKLSPALAAGCAVVLKPDPQTPLSVLRVAELATEVGFPAGAINIVPAEGPTTGSYLVKHPGVDKVAFTGSTRTGSEIMRLCSEPIKRLTLELGGKSPGIVFADANLDDAIPSSVWSIYYAAGQSCEARSRVLVEASVYDDFVARFAEAAKQLKVGDPLDAETQVGSLISAAHRDRVHGYVEKGREEGAEVVLGGEAGNGAGAFYLPTVLAGVESSMTVAQEEIFGPVVTAIPFEDEKDAIRIANDVQYGLFATVWTGDPARGHRVARAIKSGMVGINMPFTAFPGIP